MNDERRTIHEEDNESNQSSTQAFLTKAGNVPLGNHFHRDKTEVFFILSGGVERLVTSDEGRQQHQEFHDYDIPVGSMIVMPPRVACTFFLKPGSEMICYATERFDAGDMHPLKLE